MPRYPRVLVVAANPFTRRHSNSLTLTSLFQGWPAERLAQVYVPFVTPIEPEFDLCRLYWALTPLGLKSVRPPAPAEAGANGNGNGKAPAPSRVGAARRALVRVAEVGALRRLAHPVREWAYSRPGLLAGPAMAEIERFAPDLILSTLGNLGLQKAALRLGRRLGVPVVPYYTDDWITTEYQTAAFGPLLRRELEADFRRVLAQAPLAMTISPAMAEEYRARYGGEFLPFVRCVEAGAFQATPLSAHGGEWIELVYAGQLALNRWEALRRIGEELRALLDEGVRARLTVYTIPAHVELYRSRLTLDPVLRMAGHVENHRLPAIYDAADVLVHVESFEPEIAEYTRLSLSTKVPEYLMSGRPVLGYGPAHVGSMRHIAASGGGVVIGGQAPGEVRGGLRALLADRARLAALGERARAFAVEHHESALQRERFRSALERAAHPREPARAAV